MSFSEVSRSAETENQTVKSTVEQQPLPAEKQKEFEVRGDKIKQMKAIEEAGDHEAAAGLAEVEAELIDLNEDNAKNTAIKYARQYLNDETIGLPVLKKPTNKYLEKTINEQKDSMKNYVPYFNEMAKSGVLSMAYTECNKTFPKVPFKFVLLGPIESRWDKNAKSETGAAGYHQWTTVACEAVKKLARDGVLPKEYKNFSKETGKDPEKSTIAMIAYVRYIYKTYFSIDGQKLSPKYNIYNKIATHNTKNPQHRVSVTDIKNISEDEIWSMVAMAFNTGCNNIVDKCLMSQGKISNMMNPEHPGVVRKEGRDYLGRFYALDDCLQKVSP